MEFTSLPSTFNRISPIETKPDASAGPPGAKLLTMSVLLRLFSVKAMPTPAIVPVPGEPPAVGGSSGVVLEGPEESQGNERKLAGP